MLFASWDMLLSSLVLPDVCGAPLPTANRVWSHSTDSLSLSWRLSQAVLDSLLELRLLCEVKLPIFGHLSFILDGFSDSN